MGDLLDEELERRAAALRRPVGRHEPDGELEALLLTAHGQSIAVAVDEFDGVVAGTEVTPLPHVPGPWAGIAALRGRLVAVVDLGRLLGAGPTEVTHLAVLACEPSCALGVGAAPASARLRPDDLVAPERAAAPLNRAVVGVTADGTPLVDTALLLSVLEQTRPHGGHHREGDGP